MSFQELKLEGVFLVLKVKLVFYGLNSGVCVWVDNIHFSKKALHLAHSLIGR